MCDMRIPLIVQYDGLRDATRDEIVSFLRENENRA